jgi:hypothetical protein
MFTLSNKNIFASLSMKNKKTATQEDIVAKRLKVHEKLVERTSRATKPFALEPHMVSNSMLFQVSRPEDFAKFADSPLADSFIRCQPAMFMEFITTGHYFDIPAVRKALDVSIRERMDKKHPDLYFERDCIEVFFYARPSDFCCLSDQIDTRCEIGGNIRSEFAKTNLDHFAHFIGSCNMLNTQTPEMVKLCTKLRKRYIREKAKEYLRFQAMDTAAMSSAYLHMRCGIPISSALIVQEVKLRSIVCNNGVEYQLDGHTGEGFGFTKAKWDIKTDWIPVVSIHHNAAQVVQMLQTKLGTNYGPIGNIMLFSGMCDLFVDPNVRRMRSYMHEENKKTLLYNLKHVIIPHLFQVRTNQTVLDQQWMNRVTGANE